MQAVAETLFDAVYLITVITLGIRMIRKCQGQKQFRLFGVMAIVLGAGDAFHLIPRAVALLYHWPGKLYSLAGHRETDYLHYHDGVLYSSLLCMETAL